MQTVSSSMRHAAVRPHGMGVRNCSAFGSKRTLASCVHAQLTDAEGQMEEQPTVALSDQPQLPPRPPVRPRAIASSLREVAWSRWEMRMLEAIDAARAANPDPVDEWDGIDIGGEAAVEDAWAAYFQQFNDPAVHLPQLQSDLTSAWQLAIEKLGPSHIKDKLVLVVGCGPGLLALMCAQAGAKKVVAVDGCKAMTELTQQVAEANGFSKTTIEVVHGQVERLALKEKADVVLCDWAGPALLHGGMHRSFLHARRRLLKPGGIVLPSRAEVFVTGIEDRQALAALSNQWQNISGFDYGSAMSTVVTTPRLATLSLASQVCTSSEKVADLADLSSVTLQAMETGLKGMLFELKCLRDERLFGLMVHHDLSFGLPGQEEVAVLSSNPLSHHQLLLNFPRGILVKKGDLLHGQLSVQHTGMQGRDLQVDVAVDYKGVVATANYRLNHSMPTTAHAQLLVEALEQQ